MKTVSDILFDQRQGVGRVALELIPDLLGGIEFWRVLGEELGVQAGIVPQHSFDSWPFVDLPLVPQEDDRSKDVAQKLAQERGHMHGLEVVLLEASVQADAPANRADREDGQGRDCLLYTSPSPRD